MGAVNGDHRAIRTRQEISKRTRVIYQGVLIADTTVGGTRCQVVAVPDFLVADGSGGCIIRDSKISRWINETDHPEILLQMGRYGWIAGMNRVLKGEPKRHTMNGVSCCQQRLTIFRGGTTEWIFPCTTWPRSLSAHPGSPVAASKDSCAGTCLRPWSTTLATTAALPPSSRST